MGNMNNVINNFKNNAEGQRLKAAVRSTSLKEAYLKNDANMASKRKADWSALNERADQLHVRQAKMDLADMEAKVAADEAARSPRYTEGEMEEVKVTAFNKGFWIGTLGTLMTAAIGGGYWAYKKNKAHKEEIDLLERRIEDLKK